MPYRRFIVAVIAVSIAGCGGGGSEKTVPNPLAPGEGITVALCGSTTEPRSPCGENAVNSIQISVFASAPCPCFSFAFLNQNLRDLGAGQNVYEFTGFRPGTYQVTGQLIVNSVDFKFFHNSGTSTIGVAPSSLRSLSGPVKSSSQSCSIGYQQPPGNPQPANFSFEFTVAAGTQGGTC